MLSHGFRWHIGRLIQDKFCRKRSTAKESFLPLRSFDKLRDLLRQRLLSLSKQPALRGSSTGPSTSSETAQGPPTNKWQESKDFPAINKYLFNWSETYLLSSFSCATLSPDKPVALTTTSSLSPSASIFFAVLS